MTKEAEFHWFLGQNNFLDWLYILQKYIISTLLRMTRPLLNDKSFHPATVLKNINKYPLLPILMEALEISVPVSFLLRELTRVLQILLYALVVHLHQFNIFIWSWSLKVKCCRRSILRMLKNRLMSSLEVQEASSTIGQMNELRVFLMHVLDPRNDFLW